MKERRYNVHGYHVNPKTGVKTGGYSHGVKLNNSPMTHKEAVNFRWANDMNCKGWVVELVEIKISG